MMSTHGNGESMTQSRGNRSGLRLRPRFNNRARRMTMAADSANAAMVLSGGAAYGPYEVGVMLALFNGDCPSTGGRPLVVNQFAGTSIGAYNAAAMVAGAAQGLGSSAERLSRIWLDEIAQQPNGCDNGIFRVRGGDLRDAACLCRPTSGVRAIRVSAFFAGGFGPAVTRFAQLAWPLGADALTRATLEQLDVSALFDLSGFEDLLRRTVPLDKLLPARIALRAVATNFDTGALSVFTERDKVERAGHKAILASSALPGIVPAVDVDGALHVDGGALMNTPLIPAVHGGSDVHINPPVGDISPHDLEGTLGVLDRMIVTSFALSMNEDIDMIGDFNRSLELGGKVDPAEETDEQLRRVRVAATAAAQWVRTNGMLMPTEIHRYFPDTDLGGALGFLDLSYEQVVSLIDRGYRDARCHDCMANGCVLPNEALDPLRGATP
jgi:predicted acylesterase/phospholipase RssA